jgi:uncharacterized protein (TIGR03546 family)
MFIIKFIRKLFAALSSGVAPGQLALGFCIGVLLALTPFWAAHTILFILLLLALRANFSMALLAIALLKPLWYLFFDKTAYRVGRFMLEDLEGLKGFWKWINNLPGIALMGLENYQILGSLVLALALAIVLFFPVRYLVIKYRETLHERLAKSKFFKWATNLWIVRALKWLFVGGVKKGVS